jgi:uncharacterized repeat protein (TIGR01451 family)
MRERNKFGFVLAGAMAASLLVSGPASGGVPPQSDLNLTKTADDVIGVVGQDVTYTITVRNDGPDPAANVVVTDLLPAALGEQSISASGLGTCTLTPILGCTFPAIANGDSETVTLIATPLEARPVTNTAGVSSDSADAQLSDNAADARVIVAPAACTQVGTQGTDRLRGTSGADVLCGLGGNDRLVGLGGQDRLLGGSGRDALRGGAKDDTLAAGNGRDRLWGAAGRDVLRGGRGADLLRGGPARDRVFGQAGRDRCMDTARDRATSC